MTDAAIQRQIEVIKKINSEARKSKETAKKFLIDAGIIKEKPSIKSVKKKK
jgi:hypothetical protein